MTRYYSILDLAVQVLTKWAAVQLIRVKGFGINCCANLVLINLFSLFPPLQPRLAFTMFMTICCYIQLDLAYNAACAIVE